LLITYGTLENRWCDRLGELSYSLYLLHIPVGLHVIGLLSRLPFAGSYLVVIDLVAIAAAIVASAIFFRWIEGPSQRWSSAIRIQPRPKAHAAEDFVPAVAAGAAGD
jgi:peptidoglycan/LPS O-acetylase OafA/YrhL